MYLCNLLDKSIFKFCLLILMTWNSSMTGAQTRLFCEVNYDEAVFDEINSIKSKLQLKIDQHDGQYWRLSADGHAETIKKKHLVFSLMDPEIDFKFSAIPESGQSDLVDDSDDTIYKYKKHSIYKTGFEKIENFFLDRISGRLEMSENWGYNNRKTNRFKRVAGYCSKKNSLLKF